MAGAKGRDYVLAWSDGVLEVMGWPMDSGN